MSTLNFSGHHRIRIGNAEYPLHGFTSHPIPIRPAGEAPEAEDARRASGPLQSRSDLVQETVTFSCDLNLTLGEIYDYFSPDNDAHTLRVVVAEHPKYRGVVL